MATTTHRYAHHGPESFGDAELLGLVLGNSSSSSGLRTAATLLERFGTLDAISRASVASLAATPGLGPTRAARLHAALAAGRRSLRRPPDPPHLLRSPLDALELVGPPLRGLPHEELHGVYLDRRHRVLGQRRLTVGSDAFTVVDPRQVLRPALSLSASAVILAHNHPSGDPTPSQQDRVVTRRVADAARIVGLRLLDHLVIGDHGHVSLAEQGECG